MKEKNVLYLDLIRCKIEYILSFLANYSSLDLSKGIYEISNHLEIIKLVETGINARFDIRDVIALRGLLETLEKRCNESNGKIGGHKISCLLFEASTMLKLLMLDWNEADKEILEYLDLSNRYLAICGQIINRELLGY